MTHVNMLMDYVDGLAKTVGYGYSIYGLCLATEYVFNKFSFHFFCALGYVCCLVLGSNNRNTGS